MSWVTVIWSMIASVCLTLATIYLLIWFRERRSWAYLHFFVLAVGVVGMAAGEFAAMYAKSPTEYGAGVRWGHFAYGFIAVGSLGFVHFYFGTGKGWLLGAALGLRLLAVVVNFSTGLNLHIGAIQSLQSVNFLGEPVSMLGEWTANPWVRLGQIAALAQVVYVVDASLRLWRTGARESRRRAVMVGGTLAFFILFASAQAGLVAAGVLRMPMIVSFPFLAVLLAMGYELTRDVLRAAQLTHDLHESEERMTLATEAAGVGVWVWNIVRNQFWGSERWLEFFGFAPDAAPSFEKIIQRIHPDDRERVEREVWRAVQDKIDYRGEYRVILLDGAQRWLAARGRMYADPHGQPARMLGVALDITERKRMEEVDRNAQELMAAIFNSVPGLLYLYAEDGRLVRWNRQHEVMTGYASEELLNFPIQNWFAKEDQIKLAQEFSKVLSEGSTLVEMNLKLKNGEKVPYSFTGTKVIIDGKPCLVGIGINISERKRIEEASRSAHELMAAVFNSVPGLLYLYREDGQIVQWNKQHEVMTGFTAEELLNRRARDWYDDEDLSTFDRAIRTIFSEGYAEAELKLIHKNGERVPYFLTGSKVIIDGKPHLVGIAIDISARKKAEELLRESEERMTLAAEAAGFGVWMWSIPGNQVWGSERWLHLFGFPPDAAISFEMVMQRIHPDDRERVEREVRRALENRADYTGEYRVILPDGTQRWIAARGRMHSDTQGKLDRMMGAAVDITGRKHAELEAVRQRNELAHAGRVSTMGQLASTLAHELNQPLGAILRNAEAAELFLQDPSPDLDEVRAIVADIRKDDQRAGEVIDRMRALLKRRGLELTTLDIAELVDDVVPLVHPDTVSRRVKLEVEIPRKLPPVRGDRVHLQQVLLNLILNGMDAMGDVPAEARRLVVRARQADAGTIEVAVADAGHGVPAEKFARLFEPFFTTKPNGMGLGLPISSTIIEAHGGRIWAENSPSGATFFFTVPITPERVAS